MPKPPKAWSRRPAPAPWTPEEDDKIREITRIGLGSHFYESALPGRSFSEIIERRLQLAERGVKNS
ncbi:hypothetical protein SZ64_04245 [Erythrobacter sp. SG61-1L]|uniref:hypothetical protein n=1 Tax=Erythrobacter sp. SG61-1L TaxID=1603897 RepID=UPI0006C935FB|nr:hypothetical protein [Erythrobacter sp. SG61-1L]KPL67382.1 hypothetical protein SZ64_04245 [Erythrobacter sp. SG61-1L]